MSEKYEWQKISEAPQDETPIYLKCESRPDYGERLMYWDKKKKRWAGYYLGMCGAIKTWWDEKADQPTHFKLPPPPEAKP